MPKVVDKLVGDTDDEDYKVHKMKSPFITYDEDQIILRSPTFGNSITIKNPGYIKLGSSIHSMYELENVEDHIKGLSVLPDFGYGQDNYLLSKNNEDASQGLG